MYTSASDSPDGGEVPASLDGYELWRAIEHNVAQQEETVEHMKAALLTAARYITPRIGEQ